MSPLPTLTTAAPSLPSQVQRTYSQQLQSQRGSRIPEPAPAGPDQSEPENTQQPGADRLSLSPEGLNHSTEETQRQVNGNGSNTSGEELTDDELKMLEKLKQRDREVRAHEQAHLANAGQYAAGGPSFTYQRGPDGNQYAIGGEVPIDIGKERTPEETIRKMQAVRRAALAPASPSGADRNIAAAAAGKEARARLELRQQEAMDNGDTQSPLTVNADADHANQADNSDQTGLADKSISTLA